MRISVLVFVFACQSSCSLFLPSHSRSYCVSGERVTLELITAEHMGTCTNVPTGLDVEKFKTDYRRAFGDSPPGLPPAGQQMPVIKTAVASAAVGFVVDFVKAQLEEESERYRAQYVGQVASDRFWTRNKDGLVPNVIGFLLRRYWEDSNVLASEIVVGFNMAADGSVFRVCPLSMSMTVSKAKILSDEIWWLPLPTTWVRYAAGSTGHEVGVSLGVEMNGYWVDDKSKDLHVANIAALDLQMPAYDLNARAQLHVGDGSLRAGPSGWLLAPPVSALTGHSPGLGVFDLRVVITEHDPSNAKKWLEKLANRVGEEKDNLVNKVKG